MSNPTKITQRKLEMVYDREIKEKESLSQDEFDAVGSTVSKTEFDIAANEINSLAEQYSKSINMDIRIKLWSKIWDISDYIFLTKNNKSYKDFSANGKYAVGEFLNEVFIESFDDILKSYVKKANVPGFDKDDYPFIKHFNIAFPVKVHQAYDNQLNSMPHDFIIVNQATFLYELPSEEYRCSSVLKAGTDKRVKGQKLSVGTTISKKLHENTYEVCTTEEWYEIYQSSHMKTAYIKTKDVTFYPKIAVGGFPEDDEGNTIEFPDVQDPIDDFYDNEPFEKYILVLWTLLQKLFRKKSEARVNVSNLQFTKYDCFRLFYTETLIDTLKKVYGIMSLDSIKERDSIQVADKDFLDFVLSRVCRDFPSIAQTSLKKNKSFGCTCRRKEEELSLPVPYDLFGAYFRIVRGINVAQDSIRPRMSASWTEYSNLYQLLCNIYIKNVSYEDLQRTFQNLTYDPQKLDKAKAKTNNRSSTKHGADCSFLKI